MFRSLKHYIIGNKLGKSVRHRFNEAVSSTSVASVDALKAFCMAG